MKTIVRKQNSNNKDIDNGDINNKEDKFEDNDNKDNRE